MGFVAFIGRVLFSLIFVLSAWQKIMDFGHDGGAAVKLLEPKYVKFKNNVTTHLGVHVPEIEMKHLLMAAIGLEGLGSILFIFGSPLGAYLLLIFLATVTPIMHDFYNFDVASPEYVTDFIQFLNLSATMRRCCGTTSIEARHECRYFLFCQLGHIIYVLYDLDVKRTCHCLGHCFSSSV